MSVSRSEILDLLAKGKITAVEAADLLAQTDKPAVETAVAPAQPAEKAVEKVSEIEIEEAALENGPTPAWFRVRVSDLETGKNRVSVNIPVRMLNWGLRLGRRFTTELDDLNWDEINTMMTDMKPGMLVEVQDEDSKEHVQVYLE